MKSVRKSVLKLRKLKEIRRKKSRKKLSRNTNERTGSLCFYKRKWQSQVVYEEGRWVKEHIRTAVLKYNYEIDKIDKLLVKDFTDSEVKEYEKTFLSD